MAGRRCLLVFSVLVVVMLANCYPGLVFVTTSLLLVRPSFRETPKSIVDMGICTLKQTHFQSNRMHAVVTSSNHCPPLQHGQNEAYPQRLALDKHEYSLQFKPLHGLMTDATHK